MAHSWIILSGLYCPNEHLASIMFLSCKEGEVKKEGEEEEKEQEKLGKLEFTLDYNFTDSQVGDNTRSISSNLFRLMMRIFGFS